MRWTRFKQVGRERGDTIVEVLIAIAVIGTVLGSSAVIINKNVKTNLATQERGQASKVAEMQYELVKVATSTNPAFITGNDSQTFCMKDDATIITSGCTFDSLYTVKVTLSDPSYKLAPTENPQGRKVHVNVTWESATGSGMATLDRWGEVYRNDYN